MILIVLWYFYVHKHCPILSPWKQLPTNLPPFCLSFTPPPLFYCQLLTKQSGLVVLPPSRLVSPLHPLLPSLHTSPSFISSKVQLPLRLAIQYPLHSLCLVDFLWWSLWILSYLSRAALLSSSHPSTCSLSLLTSLQRSLPQDCVIEPFLSFSAFSSTLASLTISSVQMRPLSPLQLWPLRKL